MRCSPNIAKSFKAVFALGMRPLDSFVRRTLAGVVITCIGGTNGDVIEDTEALTSGSAKREDQKKAYSKNAEDVHSDKMPMPKRKQNTNSFRAATNEGFLHASIKRSVSIDTTTRVQSAYAISSSVSAYGAVCAAPQLPKWCPGGRTAAKKTKEVSTQLL